MGLNESGSEVVLQPSLFPPLSLSARARMLPLSLSLQSATQKVLNVTHRGMHTYMHTQKTHSDLDFCTSRITLDYIVTFKLVRQNFLIQKLPKAIL